MKILAPYLLFLGEADHITYAKTGVGVQYWCPEKCLGQIALEDCQVDLGLPVLTLEKAAELGVKTLMIGVANKGGYIDKKWISTIISALKLGMDVASGLHEKLQSIPEIVEAAKQHGRSLFDVRHTTQTFKVGTGVKRSGRRLLTVGTECAVGKKYTALSIHKALQQQGQKATFRATGQTGIFIAGGGVAVDSVVADFISGAAEWLSPDNTPDHWDIIEGQGSLFHPAYAGVSLGLLHGSQPDALVVCHDASRSHLIGLDTYKVPSLAECMDANISAGKLTNPAIRAVGVSVNTSHFTEKEANQYMRKVEDSLGVPCIDPVRTGAEAIAAYMAETFK